MAPKPKISSEHPAYEDIVKWLTGGVSVRDVEHRLEQMFPEQENAHLRCSFSTLQSFRQQHLNIESKVLDDIKDASALTKQQIRREAIQAELEKSTAYKDKVNALVDEKLQVQRELTKVFTILEARIEAIFNQAQLGALVDTKLDRVLTGYIEQLRGLLVDYSKIIDGVGDVTTTNINISVMTDQVAILREAVRETLADMDPSLAVRFMDKIANRLRTLQYGPETDLEGVMIEVKK